MKEKLLALYELQQLDSALDAINRQYAALDRGQAEKAEYDTLKAAHNEALTALHTIEAEVNDATLERQSAETKRKQTETKLYSGSVSNPKELQAMTDEVDSLTRRRERLDEKLIQLTTDLHISRDREAAAKKTTNAAARAYNAKATAANEQKNLLTGQSETLLAQRNEASKSIAPDWMKRYDTLRASKKGIAIVALEDSNACGGCKMGVSRDIMLRVHMGEGVVLCENCGRLLCDKPK